MKHSYLKKRFLQLSAAKINEGIFDGPRIKKWFKSKICLSYLTPIDNKAWNLFQMIAISFPVFSPDYEAIVSDLLKNYNKIGRKFHDSIVLLILYILYSFYNFIYNRRKYVKILHGWNISSNQYSCFKVLIQPQSMSV